MKRANVDIDPNLSTKRRSHLCHEIFKLLNMKFDECSPCYINISLKQRNARSADNVKVLLERKREKEWRGGKSVC